MFNESTSGEGMFRALVQQTGPKTCEMLYKIAETVNICFIFFIKL